MIVGFVAGEPRGEAALFILGGYDGHDLVEEWCPSVNFFTTAVDGDVVAVGHVAAGAAEMWRPVVGPPVNR